jgi:diacylglycerol kinase (ATP)
VEEGADLVLAFGGDGTINEVINGLACSKAHLGIIPGGTANVLAMEIGLGSNLDRAAERLNSAEPQRIALGRITTPEGAPRYFAVMAGAGLDANIVTQVDSELKRKIGKGAYWAAGLKQLPKSLDQFQVNVNGTTLQSGFALVSRVRNYGGDLEIASGASLRRGDFEVVVFEGSSPVRYLGYMAAVAVKQVQKMPGVHTFHSKSVEIATQTHLQVDGEYSGNFTATIDIVPDALTMLLPKSYG